MQKCFIKIFSYTYCVKRRLKTENLKTRKEKEKFGFNVLVANSECTRSVQKIFVNNIRYFNIFIFSR